MLKLIGIFLVSLTLRVLASTIPTNVDEALWMSRGITFMNNLLEGNLEATYIRHHPGVVNMWLIGSGQLINSLVHHLFPGLLKLNQPPLLYTCVGQNVCPLSLWVMPRLLQAVVTSGCMVFIYILTKKLLGRSVAVIAIALLLLEPFFLAYQRYITTDALQTDFSILAVLLLLLYLRGNGNRTLLFSSGIFMGLATASKIPALFILPAIVVRIVLIELGVWRTSFPKRGWIRQISDLIVLGMTASAIIFLILPALWVAPLETFEKLYEGLLREADRGNLFFLGQMTDSPGLLFYPLVLAYRLSPLLQLGLLACLAKLLMSRLRNHSAQIPELVAIALIPLSVLLILSNIDSKIDRYIILILPELALLAGVGWLQIYAWVKPWGRIVKLHTNRGIHIAIALAVAQLFLLVPYYPYYLTYYNPLLGGLKAGKNLFVVGQGEGLDRAARWLNQSPNAKEMTVISWYSSVLSPYFSGSALEMYWSQERELNLLRANRVVLYINQLQRQLPDPEMLAYFAVQQPLYTWQPDNVDYVLVYPGLSPLPEDLERIQVPLSLSWGKQVRLLGYDLNTSKLKSRDELIVTFYWEFLESPPSDLILNISLANGNGKILNSSETSLVNGYLPFDKITPGTITRDVRKLALAEGTAPGLYRLEVGWVSPNNVERLEVRNGTESSQKSQVVIGEVEIDI